MNIYREKTPYKDINMETIHTNDIIVNCDNLKDYGIVEMNSHSGEYVYGNKRIEYNKYYLILGDTTDELSTIVYELWKILHQEEKEKYYYDTGIIGFLEEFCLNDKYLTEDEIELTLGNIQKYEHEKEIVI